MSLAKKLDNMTERKMVEFSDVSLEQRKVDLTVTMLDQMLGVCLAKNLDSLMERMMDELSDVCLEKKKVDLMVTTLD